MRPRRDELVICKIVKVNPVSVIVELEEYNVQGMIHISEIAFGWIKDIRSHVKTGQIVVAKVLRADDRGIMLSLKRVSEKQRNDKLKQQKFDQKAEALFKHMVKDKGDLRKKIDEKIGSLYDAFKLALTKPQLMEKRGFTKELVEAMKKVAEKNFAEKELKIRLIVKVKSLETDGLDKIKDFFGYLEKKGLSVTYISAPDYLVKFGAKNKKEIEAKKQLIEKIAKSKGLRIEIVEK
jgi:translation initiation factor 2 subunit 1